MCNREEVELQLTEKIDIESYSDLNDFVMDLMQAAASMSDPKDYGECIDGCVYIKRHFKFLL